MVGPHLGRLDPLTIERRRNAHDDFQGLGNSNLEVKRAFDPPDAELPGHLAELCNCHPMRYR